VAWEKVQRPLDLGGLGILNLEYMSWALQIHWLWFEKFDANHSWHGPDIPVHPIATALFNMATESQIGKGLDKWISGHCVADLAPAVLTAVPLQIQRECSVAEALVNHKWVTDIRSGLSLIGLVEFFHLWDIMQEKEFSKRKIDIYGDLTNLDNSLPNLPIDPSFREQSPLNHGKESGKHGAR
jgi:hypothetical protein